MAGEQRESVSFFARDESGQVHEIKVVLRYDGQP